MVARLQSPLGVAAVFWLLAVAWLCANVRPASLASVLQWVGEARNFTHQQRLTLEVAFLLGGNPDTVVEAQRDPVPEPKRAPAAPLETAFKKLEAPLARGAELPFGDDSARSQTPGDMRVAGTLRAAPPHGPPRADGGVTLV